MKMKLVAGTFAFALSPVLCHAQANTVTLYGIADAAIESIKSGPASATRVQSGGLYQSRWGIRGTEDLGGGLAATFNLENRFNIDDGSNFQGIAFGGRAVVGLTSNAWGSIVLGREYVPLYDIKVFSNPFGVDPYSAPQTIIVAASRADNSVRYDSPRWAGFSFATQYSFGAESATVPQQGRHMNFSVQYTRDNLWVGLGTTHIKILTAAANSSDETILGVRYRFAGGTTAYANYWRMKTDNVGAADTLARAWTVGASTLVGERGLVALSYTSRNSIVPAADDARHLLLGYEYSLSKRTTLYTQYVRITNRGNSNIAVSGFANTGVGSGNVSDPRAYQMGVRHTF